MDINRGEPTNWNNKIRKAYWIFLIIGIVSGLASWPIIINDDQAEFDMFVKTSLILQNSILLGIMLITELIYRMRTRLQDYLMITVAAGFAITFFSLTPPTVYGVYVAMLLPVLISILYFSYRKVIFATLLTLSTYIALLIILPHYQESIPVEQIALVVCSIIGCCFLAVGIVGRGLRIMETEKKVLIQEEKLIRQKLSMGVLVSKDALTGLDNHRSFQERLRYSVDRHAEYEPIHLAVMDIDNFKKVNDNYGHWVGDIVLRRLGILIGEHSSECVFATRYGGEEFAVVFTRMDSGAVKEWIRVLYERLDQLLFPEMGYKKITISVGCGHLKPSESKELLFERTDKALYKAKMGGKNRVVWS